MTWKDLLNRRDVLILDAETTGTKRDAEIVDLAILDTTGQVRFNSPIMPTGNLDTTGSLIAADVHGLTLDNLRSMRAAEWPQHHDCVVGMLHRAARIVVWNAAFDSRMLRQTAAKHGLSLPLGIAWHCARLDFAAAHGETCLYRGRPSYRLQTLDFAYYRLQTLDFAYRPYVNAQGVQKHRAIDDCRQVLKVMQAWPDAPAVGFEQRPERHDPKAGYPIPPLPVTERLWPLFPCAEMDNLRRWAMGIIGTGGLAPVKQLIERLEGTSPEKLSKRQLTGAADALARLSIGMAPDPRFALRSPKPNEPVVLFQLPNGITALENVSEKYKSILVAIAIGSFVAHADGTIATKEHNTLKALIDAADLSGAEPSRLLANLQWMFAVPPNLTLLRRRLRDVPENAKHELGQIAIALAAADGVIAPGEIEAIEKLYKAMGLTAEGVYSDLHSLTAQSELVTARPAGEQERDFAIPPPPSDRDSEVALDAKRVASVMADTARVSSVLEDIFRDGEPAEEPDETQENVKGGFPGLDAYHAAFLRELLTRPHWDEAEFSTLAGQFKLMQAGALETLNEWSFEHFSDMLIEEYNGYELNPDIAAELRA